MDPGGYYFVSNIYGNTVLSLFDDKWLLKG